MNKAYIFTGTNASGKSTLISYLYENNFIDGIYINPDLILQEKLKLPETTENYLKAFKIASKTRNKMIQQKQNIVIETTFSSKNSIKLIKNLLENSYEIIFIYLTTDSPKINAIYLMNRVIQGGHDVPLKLLLQRKKASFENAQKIKNIVHQFITINNSNIDNNPTILSNCNFRIDNFKEYIKKSHQEKNKILLKRSFFEL